MTNTERTIISKEIRFSSWEAEFGRVYSHRCSFSNCSNIIKVSDFKVGYIEGLLKPICNKCKTNEIQINEEQPLIHKSIYKWWLCCFDKF